MLHESMKRLNMLDKLVSIQEDENGRPQKMDAKVYVKTINDVAFFLEEMYYQYSTLRTAPKISLRQGGVIVLEWLNAGIRLVFDGSGKYDFQYNNASILYAFKDKWDMNTELESTFKLRGI